MTRAVGIALMLAGLIGCIHLAVATDGEAGVTTVSDRDSGGDVQDSGVVVLTASSFDAIVKAHRFVLVDFYGETLAPEYAKAAADLRELDLDVVLAKVDCTAETALAERFRITSYPTLKWIVAGQATSYSGPVKA
ncbi:protein disulfide-isomerase, partial [Haematococcus lacustris]